jgi:hypothetical protein
MISQIRQRLMFRQVILFNRYYIEEMRDLSTSGIGLYFIKGLFTMRTHRIPKFIIILDCLNQDLPNLSLLVSSCTKYPSS